MTDSYFANASDTGEIPSFNGDEKAKATDYANYFCSYAQLYHQKQMLADHNRMAAYHAAIMGNSSVFKDKVVMDIGTGSGILAVWAAQAGAKHVYAIEYTDMAKHATTVVDANGLSDVVTVIQGSIEDVELPPFEKNGLGEDYQEGSKTKNTETIDIIVSEWMGYFLLRESMLDSIIRARDKFLKKSTGLMFPSHVTMFFAPIQDEEERRLSVKEYNGAMGEWAEFVESTRTTYGVEMGVLGNVYDREQKEYYLLSSRWMELSPNAVLAEAASIKHLDMSICTLADAKGIDAMSIDNIFDFEVLGSAGMTNVISGFAGWFTADFKSRTDDVGRNNAPLIPYPAHLNTGPEAGYTHWGQQTFYLLSSIPLINGEITRLKGSIEMTRTKENARLYNCKIKFCSSRRKQTEPKDGNLLMKGGTIEHIYQML